MVTPTMYQEIFGREMWRNVVVEMSYWGHKNKDACDRKNNYDPPLDEEVQRQDLQMKVIFKSILNINECAYVSFANSLDAHL